MKRSAVTRSALCAALALAPVAAPWPAVADGNAAGLAQCQPPAPGRYGLLGNGTLAGQPAALLLQEQWLPDGRIEGVRYLRQGRRFTEDRYSGSIRTGNDCWVSIERRGPAGVIRSEDSLNQQGRPAAALVTSPKGVLALRYLNQADQTCDATQLNGLVTSLQQGQSWQDGRWLPNAVVQREWWRNGLVRGMALSSYDGRIERAPYSGNLRLESNCLGTMNQRDAKGVSYNYKVLLLSTGSGYAYLQIDPDDMTLGVLQHQR